MGCTVVKGARAAAVVAVLYCACGPAPARRPVTGAASLPPPAPPAQSTAEETEAVPTEPVEPTAPFVRVGFADLPGWEQDNHGEALAALLRSCRVFTRRQADRAHGPEVLGLRAGDWRGLCQRAEKLDAADHTGVRLFLEEEMVPLAVMNDDGTAVGRFTGYYDPLLKGSRRRHGRYQTPVYKRPGDLISVDLGEFFADGDGRRIWGRVVGQRLRPYYSRSEIETGALRGGKLEILWIDDPISVFFAQVQGSARVELDTGEVMRLAYNGKNGRRYQAIGRLLVEEGKLPSGGAGLPEIRKWLTEHPKEATRVMHANDGFVFFELKNALPNRGAMAVELTAERSMAVDRSRLPLGAPLWLATTLPESDGGGEYQRLMVAQDTGGAIRGPVRGDIYFGAGARAESLAGHMVSEGRYFLLVPRAAAGRYQPEP